MKAHSKLRGVLEFNSLADFSRCDITSYLTLLCADTTKSIPTCCTWKWTITNQPKHSNTLTLIAPSVCSYFRSASFSLQFDPCQRSKATPRKPAATFTSITHPLTPSLRLFFSLSLSLFKPAL